MYEYHNNELGYWTNCGECGSERWEPVDFGPNDKPGPTGQLITQMYESIIREQLASPVGLLFDKEFPPSKGDSVTFRIE